MKNGGEVLQLWGGNMGGKDSEGESEISVSVMTFQNFGVFKDHGKRKAAGGKISGDLGWFIKWCLWS